MGNTKQQIYQIISEALDVDINLIHEGLSIGDIPEWDSVGNLTIISHLEEKLGIEIPLDNLFEMTTVENIFQVVKKIKNE
ncbi:acyl carrier protein [Prevotella dentalis DSM 3688]|uniref:Acyl carrier protein n=1 Tax=Prevotella dentalis (strain ATCC 49559 / DSM 3688 / JCM 13448 / NCTC 12043 / ES 2772) TaxID=908937 RepID=F9D6A2_PREDD|nr:acyl carrier protein [Prevotella dentalis]AGB29468.1 acyl carrier protein [Prevotella dentalis DSM 3688]EGQ12497.1 hypothetical protein HMPREF9136_2380 [Prevotella dentalis DSM 3688]